MPKISELNPLSSLSYDDLVPVVNDPNGSPSNNKVTFKNFANSVVQFFDSEKIFDRIANTANVAFANTTVYTKNTEQDLILTTKEQTGNVSIKTAGNRKFNFIDGMMTVESSQYGDEMFFGMGQGPTIASIDSLYQYSYSFNEETFETWDHGSVAYPGTYQLSTGYSNSESTSSRSSYFSLRSDVNNISAKISLANRGFISEKNWQFNANGALIFPNYGSITDSFPILEFKALEAYDTASMSGDTLTFDNASSTLLRNTLLALEVGDQIQLDGGVWSVTGIYTGGTNGSLTVNGDFSIPDIQFIQLPYKVNLIDGIRLTTHTGRTWSFGVDGALTLPNDGDIANSTGGSVLTTIANFGEGFSLTASNKIVTNKLYSTNLSSPSQHYRLTLDTNGVVHLPDESIINGAYIRTVPGSYAGLAAGPNSEHSEDSWIWVDNGGSWIATDYSNNAFTWQFDNNGILTLPVGGDITDSAGNSVINNLEIDGGNASTNYTAEITVDGGGA